MLHAPSSWPVHVGSAKVTPAISTRTGVDLGTLCFLLLLRLFVTRPTPTALDDVRTRGILQQLMLQLLKPLTSSLLGEPRLLACPILLTYQTATDSVPVLAVDRMGHLLGGC